MPDYLTSEPSFEVITQSINDLNEYPFVILPKGYTVYRAASHPADIEYFRSIARIGSNPFLDRIIKPGRCNNVKQSVFYAAEDRGTAIVEIFEEEGIKAGQEIFMTIGLWEAQRDLTLAILTLPDRVPSVPFDFSNQTVPSKISEALKAVPEDVTQRVNLISNFFVRKGNQDLYEKTSEISNIFYQAFDGIVYASVKDSHKAINFALPHKYCSNQDLVLKDVHKCKFRRRDDMNFFELRAERAKFILKEADRIIW